MNTFMFTTPNNGITPANEITNYDIDHNNIKLFVTDTVVKMVLTHEFLPHDEVWLLLEELFNTDAKFSAAVMKHHQYEINHVLGQCEYGAFFTMGSPQMVELGWQTTMIYHPEHVVLAIRLK